MAFANKTNSRVNPPPRIFSEQILKRFADPLDCLTAHLMLECAEVLADVKPANLIAIGNRPQPFGRNLYQLWQSHHPELAFFYLANDNDYQYHGANHRDMQTKEIRP